LAGAVVAVVVGSFTLGMLAGNVLAAHDAKRLRDAERETIAAKIDVKYLER
jgi:hypothetical protein